MNLSIYRCPTHGFNAVAIDDDDGGDRITPSKCCGRWDTVQSWKLTPAEWRNVSELATKAADEEAKART